jgi:hypothetical protein
MILHQHKENYKKAIELTAATMDLKAIYVEKDYWVTYALFTLFNNEIGKDTIFKGGTALSKCYNFIERFSEDIDLVVLRREGESNNKLTNKIKAISEVVKAALPEVQIEGLTQKMGMNRKTAHTYNKEFIGNYGQVRDVIVVEATWLGYYEPFNSRSIVSFIGQMMMDNNQSNLATDFGLQPFNVLALEPTRTICEKIMSLVRFSYSDNPIDDLKKKIRHTYDLHQLLQQQALLDFFNSPVFSDMLIKVGHDDVASFRNNNKWLIHHPNDALLFKDIDNVWNELKTVYNGDFKNLVYGILPKEEAVLGTLKMIQERLKTISWTIKIDA